MEEGKAGGGGAAEKMKRSASELALDELLQIMMIGPQDHPPLHDYCYDSPHSTITSITDAPPLSLHNWVSLGLDSYLVLPADSDT